MRALYIWGTLVACLSIVNRDDFEPLAISDEELLETRDADALSNEEDFSPMKAMKISVGGGARGGGGSIGGAGRGGGGSSGSAGRGGGDSSGSSGRGGGDSSGSAGRGGAGGSKGGQGSSGYGKNSRPDRSEDSSPPPPYSKGDNAPPPPYSRGSYGQTGPSRSYWNGQYYPYRSYGYGGFFPFLGLGAAAPLLLAGPFGLYGHYCGGSRSDNCTVKNYYVNGTRNDTSSSEINLVNGTYYEIVWQDSTYELRSQVGGVYRNAQLLDTDQNIAVNGTYAGNSSSWESKTINPNVTSNGTTLESSDNSGAASLRTPPVYVSLGAIAVTALLI